MKAYGECMCRSTYSWLSAIVAGEWSASHPGRFTTEERGPCTHLIGGWVPQNRSRRRGEEKCLAPTRPLGRPARIQSPRYPGSSVVTTLHVWCGYVIVRTRCIQVLAQEMTQCSLCRPQDPHANLCIILTEKGIKGMNEEEKVVNNEDTK
jgi:hypothetical protein